MKIILLNNLKRVREMNKNVSLSENSDKNLEKRKWAYRQRNWNTYYWILVLSPDSVITTYWDFVEDDKYDPKRKNKYTEIEDRFFLKKHFVAQLGVLRMRTEINFCLDLHGDKNKDDLNIFLNEKKVKDLVLSQVDFVESLYHFERDCHIGSNVKSKFNVLEGLLVIQGLESFNLDIQDLLNKLLRDGDNECFVKDVISRLPQFNIEKYFPNAHFYINSIDNFFDVVSSDSSRENIIVGSDMQLIKLLSSIERGR